MPPPWSAGPGNGRAPAGYAAAAPEVVTTPAAAPAQPRTIDPFRTDGTSILRTPVAHGGQYRTGAHPGAWGPPPMWAPPPRTDPTAIIALVLGIIGLLVFPLVLSQAALVLGIVGVRRVRRTGDEGFGLAVGGIVLGSLGTLGVLAFVAFFASVAWWGL